ncbi:radical SAM protein [Marinitoga sp. 1135]|uniref:radical SAM protein n=1 Tax=unclassified Marinitoga TaxID=2640159 RepID=UPI000950A552|nr:MULTISPECIES: radical SAM protein [unclassified Marinitoga]APT75179.1 radical SAM protein [Marinitoga sp. 1137]NUU94953.1 radical SAM protein [Marinitoga sp. 1135]NUU96922.1 radical SAM protein [Marinitoga sp. 1138]
MAEILCKSIITKSKLPETDYCCNIYVGCTHGCVYCYARFMKRFTGHTNEEWGYFVDYKSNAINVLKKDIKKIKKYERVLMGSVTDSYQPIEKKLQLTRRCLKAMADFDINISILTKSVLVLRDIDIFKRFTNCEVGISCGINNSEVSKILEPHASSIEKRFDALRKLKQNGIKCYAFIGPIIPYITDLEKIFYNIKDNVDFIMAEALNLRGINLPLFKKRLIELVGEENTNKIIATCKNNEYWNMVEKTIVKLSSKYGIENKGFFRHVKR